MERASSGLFRRVMKVLKSSDLTSPEGGSVTVVPDESDDLWVLYNLIDCDDLVTCGTSRKITKTDRAGGKGATEKRRLTLTVRATAASYDGLADCVRVSGTNASQWRHGITVARETPAVPRGAVLIAHCSARASRVARD